MRAIKERPLALRMYVFTRRGSGVAVTRVAAPPARKPSQPPADESWVYTVDEAALLLRIGRSAAYEAVRRGQLPALRLGRKLRIPRKALEQMLMGESPRPSPVPESMAQQVANGPAEVPN